MAGTDSFQITDSNPGDSNGNDTSAGQTPQAAPESSVRISQRKGYAKISLSGELDPLVIEALHGSLIRLSDAGKDIVIDCAKTEHLPAAALQLLVAAQAVLAGKQHALRIESESSAIRNYLNLAGVGERFPAKNMVRRSKLDAPGKADARS